MNQAPCNVEYSDSAQPRDQQNDEQNRPDAHKLCPSSISRMRFRPAGISGSMRKLQPEASAVSRVNTAESWSGIGMQAVFAVRTPNLLGGHDSLALRWASRPSTPTWRSPRRGNYKTLRLATLIRAPASGLQSSRQHVPVPLTRAEDFVALWSRGPPKMRGVRSGSPCRPGWLHW